jgi:1-aminocyclopropane-1-carboxylate deaminase/D-cysteine desulfhydrase-like pyridoxal-dependent ACC family enzyme
VRVASRIFSNGYTARRLARGALRHLAEKTGSLADLPKGLLRIDHRFSGSGYGLATPEGEEAARILEGEEGIHLDPTYTAKAFACLLGRCRQGWGRGMHVLYWHTLNSVPLARTRALLGLEKQG